MELPLLLRRPSYIEALDMKRSSACPPGAEKVGESVNITLPDGKVSGRAENRREGDGVPTSLLSGREKSLLQGEESRGVERRDG